MGKRRYATISAPENLVASETGQLPELVFCQSIGI